MHREAQRYKGHGGFLSSKAVVESTVNVGLRPCDAKLEAALDELDPVMDEVEEALVQNTVLVAIDALTNNFPTCLKGTMVPPIVLASQLQSSVKTVCRDADVQDLKTRGILREFRIQGIGEGTTGYVLLSQYDAAVMQQQYEEEQLTWVEALLKLLKQYQPQSIVPAKLVQMLCIPPTQKLEALRFLFSRGFIVGEPSVSASASDEEYVFFSIPGLGLYVTELRRSMEEILQKIKRTRYKEILRGKLEKSTLKTAFDLSYTLEYLISTGDVQATKTSMGDLLRLH